MKTTYTTPRQNASSLILAIVFILTIGQCHKAVSQVLKSQPQFNAGVDAYVSGSGHGAFYSGYVGITQGRHIINAGPCMQSSSMQVKGGRLCYSYILTGFKSNSLSGMLEHQEQSIQLRFFSYAQYNNKLALNAKTIAREEKLNSNERDWTDLRLSTVEVGAGASLNIRVSKRLYWNNTLAVSSYYHMTDAHMFQGRSGLMLTVGTGFNIPGL